MRGIAHEVLAETDLRKYVQQQMAMFAEIMATRLTEDKEAGSLPAAFDPPLVAAIIITYLQGIWRMALVSYNRKQFEHQIDVFLRAPFSAISPELWLHLRNRAPRVHTNPMVKKN